MHHACIPKTLVLRLVHSSSIYSFLVFLFSCKSSRISNFSEFKTLTGLLKQSFLVFVYFLSRKKVRQNLIPPGKLSGFFNQCPPAYDLNMYNMSITFIQYTHNALDSVQALWSTSMRLQAVLFSNRNCFTPESR